MISHDLSPLLLLLIPLLAGWLLDRWLGDPQWLPHPVVAFGKLIAFGERNLNRGSHRVLKGTFLTLTLVIGVMVATGLLMLALMAWHPGAAVAVSTLVVFFCLAGTTLEREVRNVFRAADCSLEDGRRQVARIVGRDTAGLSEQEVRTAALETLAENLSDGVIAPLFWLIVLGWPGMMGYKMVNTLDSMIGYRTPRYERFGRFAAKLDDAANYIPARLTALLMMIAAPFFRVSPSKRMADEAPSDTVGKKDASAVEPSNLCAFVRRYASCHASPNSGWPESVLAGILHCRFGGPHPYFGRMFYKPFIGHNNRPLDTDDMRTAIGVNRTAEVLMILLCVAAMWWGQQL